METEVINDLILEELSAINGQLSAMSGQQVVNDLILEEFSVMNEQLVALSEQCATLNNTVYLILVEVEIIAMSIIVIWLMSWIRRVTRKGCKVDG